MRLVVTVTSGMEAGRKLWLVAGQSAVIGCGDLVDFEIHSDDQIAPSHFLLQCGTDGCRIRNLDPVNGTFLNGRRLVNGTVADGDKIVAGQTQFVISIESLRTSTATDSAGSLSPQQMKECLLTYLSNLPDPLFGLLDAARHPMVLALLVKSGCEYQSLYEGPEGEALMAMAPYLVRLEPGCSLLKSLVDLGWGDSWGVFLTSRANFKEIRKNFRRWLMVETEEGNEAYFRFYDPRVLRVFLPTCLADEAQQFFGQVDMFFVEAAEGKGLLKFAADEVGSQEIVSLAQMVSTAQL